MRPGARAARQGLALEADLGVERAVALVAGRGVDASRRERRARLFEQAHLHLHELGRRVIGPAHQRVRRAHQVDAELQPLVAADRRRDRHVHAAAQEQRSDVCDVCAAALGMEADDRAAGPVELNPHAVVGHARHGLAPHAADHARHEARRGRLAHHVVLERHERGGAAGERARHPGHGVHARAHEDGARGGIDRSRAPRWRARRSRGAHRWPDPPR